MSILPTRMVQLAESRFVRSFVHLSRLALVMAICGLLASSTFAGFERQVSPFPVSVAGNEVPYPFWGGINSPKPSLVDINRDGLVDLLVGDVGGRLSYYKNTGTAQAPVWTPAIERLGGVNVGTWHLFADIDGDGDQDLFCDPNTGKIAFYKNVSVGETIEFQLADTAFGGFVIGLNNTPALADIDGDGDLDFFYGAASGYLEFYRNIGTSHIPAFQFITGIYDSVLAFPRGALASSERHGYSALRFVDIDTDGDLDLFYGDIFNPNMYYFANLGSATQSKLTYQTENYLPFPTQGFNHAAFADVDGDGDQDMVLGVANAAETNNLIYYQNNGNPTIPAWDIVDSNIIKSIDVGSAAIPTFGDIDGDGDQDLLIGGSSGRLTYFQNTGTSIAPAFTFMSDSFANIEVGLNSAPALVDWDSDGDLDLLIGTSFGRIEYWRNAGSKSIFTPVKDSAQLGGIKVDQLATPCPIDLDGDGRMDLVVGEWDFNSKANVLLYKNIGAAGAPKLALQTASLLKIDTTRAFTLPTAYDWNKDGRVDLIIGYVGSGLTLYLNTAAPGSMPDSLTLVPQDVVLPSSDNGQRLKMAFVDIDGDGGEDFFVGEADGGLNFYRGGSCCEGRRGNINESPDGSIDLTDLTYLIHYLMPPSGPVSLPCSPAANLFEPASPTIDMGDLLMLIALLVGKAHTWPTCQ